MRLSLIKGIYKPHLGVVSRPTFAVEGGIDSPEDISNLEGWWKADDLVLGEGADVGTWPAAGSTSYALSQGASSEKPHYAGTGFEGGPCVVFDGVLNSMRQEGGIDNTFDGVDKPFTIFAAFNNGAPTTKYEQLFGFYDNTDSSNRVEVSKTNAGKLRIVRWDGTTLKTVVGSTTLISGTSYILVAIFDGSNGTVRLNGSIDGGPSDATSGSMTHLRAALGSLVGSETEEWTGDIAEVGVYSKGLTTEEAEDLEGYLNDKYTIF